MVTVEQAKQHLNAWLEADLKVSQGQSYTLGSRSLTRANIVEIRKQIEYWKNQIAIAEIEASGRKVRKAQRFMPRDL